MRRVMVIAAAAWLGGCVPPAADKPRPPTVLEQRFVDRPGDSGVNFELGRQSEAAGDLLRAEQYYRRADDLAPDLAARKRVRHRLVAVLVQARRYVEAEERCRELLRMDPSDRGARFLLAAILSALDRSREAEREFESLRRESPDDPIVYLELGRLYRDALGDRRRADLMFRRYLALAPSGAEASSVRFEVESHQLEAELAARAADSGAAESMPSESNAAGASNAPAANGPVSNPPAPGAPPATGTTTRPGPRPNPRPNQ